MAIGRAKIPVVVDGEILTERLRLRPWRTNDAPAVRRMFSDPEVGEFVGVRDTLEVAEELVAGHLEHQAQHGFGQWAAEERETGELVGEIGLQLLEQTGPEVEIGWVVARPAWGRGYATEASRKWLEVGFAELGLDEIVAVIRRENEASHRVARRLGMERRGIRHAYGHDLDEYAIARGG